MSLRPRSRTAAAACLLTAAALAAGGLGAARASAGPSAAGTLPVGYNWAAAFAATVNSPATAPPGANDFGCKPSSAHPRPVILAHGTFENMHDNWQAAAPLLADHGYCVFTFNYGGATPGDDIQGTGDIAASARTLAAFVDKVLAATGAAKVDIVGHSQGGMMPRYYINNLGGAAKVGTLVGLAPSNYGTTVNGLFTLVSALNSVDPAVNKGFAVGCASCVEQEQGSPFLAALNARPTVPGVSYTVIESRNDEVVTPYTNAFLPAAPNVTNITVQRQCPADASDHLEISYDPAALADTLNALDPAHPVAVPCVPVLPLTGPVGPVPSFLSPAGLSPAG